MNLRQKKIAVFGGLFLSTLFLCLFFINGFLSSFTEDLLRERLSEQPNKLYNISSEKLKLGVFKGEIKLSNIIMSIDTNYLDSLKTSKHYPKSLYSGTVDEIKLSGINALDI